jgi:hypothetical protein
MHQLFTLSLDKSVVNGRGQEKTSSTQNKIFIYTKQNLCLHKTKSLSTQPTLCQKIVQEHLPARVDFGVACLGVVFQDI